MDMNKKEYIYIYDRDEWIGHYIDNMINRVNEWLSDWMNNRMNKWLRLW